VLAQRIRSTTPQQSPAAEWAAWQPGHCGAPEELVPGRPRGARSRRQRAAGIHAGCSTQGRVSDASSDLTNINTAAEECKHTWNIHSASADQSVIGCHSTSAAVHAAPQMGVLRLAVDARQSLRARIRALHGLPQPAAQHSAACRTGRRAAAERAVHWLAHRQGTPRCRAHPSCSSPPHSTTAYKQAEPPCQQPAAAVTIVPPCTCKARQICAVCYSCSGLFVQWAIRAACLRTPDTTSWLHGAREAGAMLAQQPGPREGRHTPGVCRWHARRRTPPGCNTAVTVTTASSRWALLGRRLLGALARPPATACNRAVRPMAAAAHGVGAGACSEVPLRARPCRHAAAAAPAGGGGTGGRAQWCCAPAPPAARGPAPQAAGCC
jgi:hypothetical protein